MTGQGVLTRYSLLPMEMRHVDEVIAIERESYTHPWSRKGFEYEIGNEPVSFTRVAVTSEVPNELAGYCVAWIVFEHLHIQNVTVHPRHRRQGLGRALVERALEEGKKRGARWALLEVRRSNVAAQQLYRKLGFREAGMRAGYYSQPPEDALLFQRELTD